MSSTDRTIRRVWLPLIWTALLLAGAGVWLVAVTGGEEKRAWLALLSNFLFFSSLAGGLVVWPAVVRTCNGRWHLPVERHTMAGMALALPSILCLVLLWIGSSQWSPWYGTTHHQGLWLDNAVVFGRNLLGQVLFWGVAALYLTRRQRGEGGITGPLLILTYSLVFSLMGFDLVMALDSHWYSTMAGGYFFISGMYIAISAWAFLTVWHPDAGEEQRHDLGQLMVAFSLMTAYMMYAQLMPIWYENLPHEVRFLVPRLQGQAWSGISRLLLALVYLGPLVLLLTERAKRGRWSLGIISLVILGGMWLERWWLVAPTLHPQGAPLGVVELSAAAAFIGLFGLGGYWTSDRRHQTSD